MYFLSKPLGRYLTQTIHNSLYILQPILILSWIFLNYTTAFFFLTKSGNSKWNLPVRTIRYKLNKFIKALSYKVN